MEAATDARGGRGGRWRRQARRARHREHPSPHPWAASASAVCTRRALRQAGVEGHLYWANLHRYVRACACVRWWSSQIDEARSRVDEVKDLVRTALAHHFVSMLRKNKNGRFHGLFVRWALMAGLQPRAATAPEAPALRVWNDAPAAKGGSDATPAWSDARVSPALQRLGLRPRTPSSSAEPCPSTAVAGLQRSSQLTFSHVPGWIRPPLRASAVSNVETMVATTWTWDVTRGLSFAGHVPEEVLAERGRGRIVEYRVKWKGFSSSQSVTWELASQLHTLSGFEEALRRFRMKHRPSCC